MKRIKNIIAIILVCVFCCAGLNVSAAVAGNKVTTDLARDFQVLNVDVVANKISVSGIAGAAASAVVSFYLTVDGEVVYLKLVNTEADGTFEAELVLSPEKYNAESFGILIVGATNANSQKIEGIELYSQAELDDCVYSFKNEINSVSDMADFLDAYGNMLAVENDYTEDEIAILYNEYVNNPPTDVSDCDQVISAINSLLNVVDVYKDFFVEINSAAALGDGAEVKRLLTVKYKDIVPFETEMIMIQNESGIYSKMVAAYTEEYTSFDDIEAAFNAAVEEQRNEEAANGYVTNHKTKAFIDSEWKMSICANMVKILGKTDDFGVHNIVFYVSDYNVTGANVLGLYQTQTEMDGSFVAEFALDPSVYGDETLGIVKVSGTDRNVYQFIIPLCSEEVLTNMTNDFDLISDEADMAEFIANYGDVLKVGDGYGEDKFKLLAELHGENEYAGLEYPEEVAAEVLRLDDAMYDVKDFIDSINTYSEKNQQGHIREAIEVKNADMVEKSKTFAILREKALDNDEVSKKGLYMRMVGKTFDCVQDIMDAYDQAYEAQKQFEAEESETPASRPSGGGGGGGGFSGPGTNIEIAPELIPVPEVEELEPEKAPVEGFKDLEGYEWAKDAIDGLRNLSIVHGDGNGNYRPGDEVTREEFLSMLLATFYIETEEGTVPFMDVKNGQWYTKVVATAYELGITNGMGDGRFGIGENIIRADMVALAARLANAQGITIKKENEAKVFADFPEIPAYAYDDVVAFQQAGLIQGDEAGKFNPNNKLTRAEAAVFFWNMFNFIERQI